MNFAMAGVDYQPFVIRFVDQNVKKFFPNPLVAPPDKAAMCVAPSAVIRRQVAPWGSCANDPKHRVDKLAIVFCDPTPNALASGQVRLQQSPDSI